MKAAPREAIRLQNLYEELNKRFFRNRLPRYNVRISPSLPSHGKCLSDRRTILLRPMEPGLLRQFLLHEMCHIGSPDHGQRFQAKLQAIADEGETWAAEELKTIRRAPSWPQEMANLRIKLDEIALLSPHWRFRDVLRWASPDLGMRPSELVKRAPWLKAAWRKACRWAHQEQRLRAALYRRQKLKVTQQSHR